MNDQTRIIPLTYVDSEPHLDDELVRRTDEAIAVYASQEWQFVEYDKVILLINREHTIRTAILTKREALDLAEALIYLVKELEG